MDSNHPTVSSKNIPKVIETRISGISSTKEIFEDAKKTFVEALKKSGYKVDLKYNEDLANKIKLEANEEKPIKKSKKKRKRNITYFNHPITLLLKTNFSYQFRQIGPKFKNRYF